MRQQTSIYSFLAKCPAKATLFGFLVGVLLMSVVMEEKSIWTMAGRWLSSLNTSTTFKFSSPIATFSGSANSQVSDGHPSVSKEPTRPMLDGYETSLANCNLLQKNFLLEVWASRYLEGPVPEIASKHLTSENLSSILSVQAPHLWDCRTRTKRNARLDNRSNGGSRPRWPLWKGLMGIKLGKSVDLEDTGEEMLYMENKLIDGPYPPWVQGADEDNLPRTRRVQRDLWLHQHPKNCSDPKLRFLLADWEREPGYGIGAQIAAMSGLLAIAVNENRILVTGYLNRADHEGCIGHKRSHWSCYFFPETSTECKARAWELASQNDSWKYGIITSKHNYKTKDIWVGSIPRLWGKPWQLMQPTTEVDGELLLHHRAADRRWWRAQAVRYLMRYPSEYLCVLLNHARHRAFGAQAADVVLSTPQIRRPKVAPAQNLSTMGRHVWVDLEPWTPKPLISLHIRQGDKASEMKVVGLEKYMELAGRIRDRFPDAKDVWLSTEMEDIIEGTKHIDGWNFYYTNVTRQHGNTSMAMYEASLGRKDSSNNAFVNFLMASEADFFIGALGSTWCFLIDGMRSTGGKIMSGYMSVNKDRFW